jgi:charged multivesicular body protein 5
MVLKRKKQFEQQRDSLSAQSFNIGNIAFAIETSKDTAQTVAAMKEAKGALAVAYKGMDIDDVMDLQDDLTDLMLDAEEIQEVMSRSYGVPDTVDESDLMDELAGLEDAWEAEGPAAAKGGVPDYLSDTALPAAPTGGVKLPPAGNRVAVGTDEYGLPL